MIYKELKAIYQTLLLTQDYDLEHFNFLIQLIKRKINLI